MINLPEIVVVADESVDAAIVLALRIKGISVLSISEENASVSDTVVLEVAVSRNAILITEDKDFGELVIRLKKPHKGILLLRLAGVASKVKTELVINTVETHFTEMQNAFSVLDKNKLRIKPL